MPYKDPAKKTEWDRAHRPDHFNRLHQASSWAEEQIRILDQIAPREQSRKKLRGLLESQFLHDGYGNGHEPTIASPADPVE